LTELIVFTFNFPASRASENIDGAIWDGTNVRSPETGLLIMFLNECWALRLKDNKEKKISTMVLFMV
jgi:hypothetical protein